MLIHELDNVEVNLENGHKYAVKDINCGDEVIKYGQPIGIATCDIKHGEHVHSHNMKTALGDNLTYKYEPKITELEKSDESAYFMGYLRDNGEVGIRNDVWIVNTVVCVNKVAEKLAGLPKGSQILIEKGQLVHSVYKKEGRTYNNIQVMVTEFIVLNENNKAVAQMEKEIEEAEDIVAY